MSSQYQALAMMTKRKKKEEVKGRYNHMQIYRSLDVLSFINSATIRFIDRVLLVSYEPISFRSAVLFLSRFNLSTVLPHSVSIVLSFS